MTPPNNNKSGKGLWQSILAGEMSDAQAEFLVKRGFGALVGAGLLIALTAFFPSPVYMLDTSNEAVIMRFGKAVRTETQAGLKFMIPFIEEANIVNVSGVRRLEFGYRDKNNKNESPFTNSTSIRNVAATPRASASDIDSESRMLTSDMNLVIADWAIQYRVTNSRDFLFNVDDPVGTLRIIAESTYRRVVAAHPLDDILTSKKDVIQNEILYDLQELCRKYQMGVTIASVQLQDALPPENVKASFLDVTAAIEEKSSKENQANKYANEKLPVARGDAQKQLNDAEGYKQSRIAEATGAVARYQSVATEYTKMPEITRTRLYLEALQEVLPQLTGIYIVDSNGGDTLKFLPLTGNTSALPLVPATEAPKQ